VWRRHDHESFGPDGRPWKLISLQTDDFRVLSAPPDRYTVTFQDGERIAARSDCNSCGGTYQIRGESLQIGPLACSRVFCGDDSLDLLYVRILEAARTYSIRDGSLTIGSARGMLRYAR
jgi:heat shock protein HslJ